MKLLAVAIWLTLFAGLCLGLLAWNPRADGAANIGAVCMFGALLFGVIGTVQIVYEAIKGERETL